MEDFHLLSVMCLRRLEATMSNLKLADWASIAEILTSVVVVVSLIYVGFELNQNTIAIQQSSHQDQPPVELPEVPARRFLVFQRNPATSETGQGQYP